MNGASLGKSDDVSDGEPDGKPDNTVGIPEGFEDIDTRIVGNRDIEGLCEIDGPLDGFNDGPVGEFELDSMLDGAAVGTLSFPASTTLAKQQ